MWIGQGIPADAAAEIQRHLGRKNTKSALKKAKRVHEELATPDSESLLVEVYRARITALREGGLPSEAHALEQMILGRYAAARTSASPPPREPQEGPWEKLLSELASPDLDAPRREAIERQIRRDLTDLPRLAACGKLPEGHGLRMAAAALAKAFDAVTRGPVADEQIVLAEVSRRSPLADWKILIRAIATLYRGDAPAVRRLLEALDGQSAAARLAPAIRALLDGPAGAGQGAPAPSAAPTEALTPPAAALVSAVRGDRAILRGALRELDEGLGSKGGRGKLHEKIRQTVGACRRLRPELLDRLKQHISIRCVMADYPADKAVSAMGGPSRHDAAFWRLYARALESAPDAACACSLWEEFRRNAI